MCPSRLPLCIVLVAGIFAVAPAEAQAGSRPPKPYMPVAVVLPQASDDAGLATFRTQLAAVAKGRSYATLARLVQTPGFFWDRDHGHAFDPRKPAVDNLAAAVALERHNGSGWDRLAAFAAEASAEPLASRPGVVCAPARPTFDSAALARLLDTTYTGVLDWVYPRADKTPVLAAAQPGAPATGTLGLHFVQVLGFEGVENKGPSSRTQWARVASPDGRIGFVEPGSLMSLTTERLCYIKDLIGGWRIAGYIEGGH